MTDLTERAVANGKALLEAARHNHAGTGAFVVSCKKCQKALEAQADGGGLWEDALAGALAAVPALRAGIAGPLDWRKLERHFKEALTALEPLLRALEKP